MVLRALRLAAGCAALVATFAGAAALGGSTAIPVAVHDHTGLRLADIVWTRHAVPLRREHDECDLGGGLHADALRVDAEGRRGDALRALARYPRLSAGALFCHSPDNLIYRIGLDGTVSVAATLPRSPVSDGAIAFDRVGRFGYALLAATGRSGNPTAGGKVVRGLRERHRAHRRSLTAPGWAARTR